MLAYAFALHSPYILLDEPTNGLDITSRQALKRIISRSMDDESTLLISTHQALHALEKEGAVESYWYDTDEGRRRKYYKLTDTGKEMLESKQKEWNVFKKAMNSIIGEECYE